MPSSSENEQSWIAGLRAGRRDAFDAIYVAYFPALWDFATRYVDRSVAEDVVHDVMFDLWQRRETAPIDRALAPYLFAAVRRRALQHTRHDRVVYAFEEQEEEHRPATAGQPPETPDMAATTGELRAALTVALQQLPSKTRAILTLRWVDGMTYEQIADAIGLSVSAVKMQVNRSQNLVRPLLRRFREK